MAELSLEKRVVVFQVKKQLKGRSEESKSYAQTIEASLIQQVFIEHSCHHF